jgi:signal transduction histidine kinase
MADSFARRIGVQVDEQVWLIKPSGELLAAEENDPVFAPLTDEHLLALSVGERQISVSYGLFRQTGEVYVPIRDVNQELLGIVGVSDELGGLTDTFLRLRWWILGITFIDLLLGVILGALLATRLEGPIGRASRAVVKIADGRDIDPILPEGPNEIQQLSEAVNMLHERLHALENIRKRSLANIVHELGRPLGAVRAAVHVLRQGAVADPDIREELLSGIENEIERMEPLLNDLAQLHGQVEGNIALHRKSIHLSRWLPPLLFPWRAAALDKGLNWHTEIPTSLPTILIDPDRMAQAIGNILSNAIKYTPEPGQVQVAAGHSEQDVWIQISDTGPGIQAIEQERIFEPFYRSQQQRRFPQGLGVGLTLARDLVRAHGGEIELVSTPDVGSRFTIRMPR